MWTPSPRTWTPRSSPPPPILTLSPATRTFVIASAGHPPPLFAHADNTTELVTPPTCLPLGVGGEPYSSAELSLPRGSTLVLYTDGLVERRGRDIDEGIARLCATIPPHATLDEMADAMVAGPAAEPGRDDIACLLARIA